MLKSKSKQDRQTDIPTKILMRNADSHLDKPMLLESDMYGQNITGM